MADGSKTSIDWAVSDALVPYDAAMAVMEERVRAIIDGEANELVWFLQHPPLYTAGTSAKPADLLDPNRFPVFEAGRGGQFTYHGPGQLVIYLLLNLRRRKMGVRELVTEIEQAIVELLAPYGIEAYPKKDAPGVYVDDKKIASLGLRVRKGCSFHGLALNINMDMAPFLRINPCGYAGLEMLQTSQLNGPKTVEEAADKLSQILASRLKSNQIITKQGLPS